MIASTSIDAYKQTALSREALCKQLMALYESHMEGLTDNEAGRLLVWHPSQVSARRADLGGLIYNKDEERRKDPVTRKNNLVWRRYYSDRLF